MPNKRGPKPGNRGSVDNRTGKITQSTALARVNAHKIASSDQAPLKVMLDNMMFWHNQSELLGKQIQETLDAMKSGDTGEDVVAQFEKSMKGFVAARQNAQSCAVDAAPYVHPRLASVMHKANNGKKILEVETVVPVSMVGAPGTDGVAASAGPDRSYRDDYKSETVIPIRRAG